ncbi:MAG: site-2 protease family protein [Candidatus Doudnabacteria bacterium]|nr:site-2 protease family protein [Candidatus Doudnabacteria bacterium]
MDPLSVVIFVAILLFSIILHEVAHGLMAEKLGDPTARFMGRLTLNPISHIDPVGSILVPLILLLPTIVSGTPPKFLFGWAKPVPVDYRNIRDVRKGLILISIVGPLTNFMLAAIAALVVRYMSNLSDTGLVLLGQVILVNIVLSVFNMIPIPPLDGSKVLAGILGYINRDWMHTFLELERYGFILVIVMIMTGVSGMILRPAVEFMYKILLGS